MTSWSDTCCTISLQEYPDYYEVIKKPIDMERIRSLMHSHRYGSVEDMVQDFLVMFDNACKYNEPDSLIYKVRAMHTFTRSVRLSQSANFSSQSVAT